MKKVAKVTKKTAFDIKEASNQKLTASARNNYAKNAWHYVPRLSNTFTEHKYPNA